MIIIIELKGTKEHWSIEVGKLMDKYGSVCTFWLGHKPQVIIKDIDLGREVFRKNDIAGRKMNVFRK